MSEFVAVLPSIVPVWTERCLAGMGERFTSSLLVVDNAPPATNIGVGAAWNLGIDRLYELDADWLVIVSASTRFGPTGGDDFLDALDTYPDAVAIEAGHGVGWHLIAFPRRVIDRVGNFDSNFFAYMEDLDYARRIALAFGLDPPYWTKVRNLDVSIAGFSHGIDEGGVRPDQAGQHAYYVAKWACVGGQTEGYLHPFNDPAHGVDWFPEPPDPRARQR